MAAIPDPWLLRSGGLFLPDPGPPSSCPEPVRFYVSVILIALRKSPTSTARYALRPNLNLSVSKK